MEVQAIQDEQTYRAILARVSDLVDLNPTSDSPEGEELSILGTLVKTYEAKHYPLTSGLSPSP